MNLGAIEIASRFAFRGYVRFRYRPPPGGKPTPSRLAERADTVAPRDGDWTLVSGFLVRNSLRMTQDGVFVLMLRNMRRKVAGRGHFAERGLGPGEFEFRSYRIDPRADGYGIDLRSVMYSTGFKGLRPLFPELALGGF